MRSIRLRESIVPFAVAGTVLLGVPAPAHAGRTVRCESQGRNRQYCRVGIHGQVRLQRQLSRSACIQGQTWGYDGGGIWVDDGCRGEFRLGYEGHHGDDGHRKRHDNTAAVAAGVLVLGALVAVAASGSKKKEKEREPAATSVENATEETPQEVIACRAAVRQKILDHHGDDTVVRFASGAGRTNGADRIEITGEGTVEAVGRSWAIAYRCVVDAASGQVLEAHVED